MTVQEFNKQFKQSNYITIYRYGTPYGWVYGNEDLTNIGIKTELNPNKKENKMTAKEAKKLADDANNALKTRFNDICEAVKRQAKLGGYSITVIGSYSEELNQMFSDAGYNVKVSYPNVEISWKG